MIAEQLVERLEQLKRLDDQADMSLEISDAVRFMLNVFVEVPDDDIYNFGSIELESYMSSLYDYAWNDRSGQDDTLDGLVKKINETIQLISDMYLTGDKS